MKRMTYVDKEGNQVNQELEKKKPLLKFFFTLSIILPTIIIILIIVTMFNNKRCMTVYDSIKKASLEYATDQTELPEGEGDNITISIGSLYSEQYLKNSSTNNVLCSGTVKITKYKNDYIYTLDVNNCNNCSTGKKYKSWSSLKNNYPINKAIVDVIPYYNYYDRDISYTKWSKYYDDDELSDEISEYNIKLPLNMEMLPEIPKEANIMTIENNTTNFYRYKDRSWKWYDIEGNYSAFSSEKPNGFDRKDEDAVKYTEWSDYSLDYPVEKSYRTIEQVTGYKFYYLNKSNKKIYYNSGKYTPKEGVNTEKYNKYDSETATLYRYRDKLWRWYNGEKRRYSTYSSKMPTGYAFKDAEIENLSTPSSWEEERHTDETTKEYRAEEVKIMTRFRIKYEMISLKILKKSLERKEFEKNIEEPLEDFREREDKKLEVTYKFKYRKS